MAGIDWSPIQQHPPRPTRRFTEGTLDNALLLDAMRLAPGQTVVDAGCGSGYMARLFAERVGAAGLVYALDINEHYIETLRRDTNGMRIKALVCDLAEATPLAAGSVDRLFIATVLHAQAPAKLPGIIQEMQRVLRPGGILGVVEFDKTTSDFGPPLERRYSPEDLKKALPFAPLDHYKVAEHFYLQLFQAQ